MLSCELTESVNLLQSYEFKFRKRNVQVEDININIGDWFNLLIVDWQVSWVKAGLELNEKLMNVLLFILLSHRRTQLKPSAKVDKKYMPHERKR